MKIEQELPHYKKVESLFDNVYKQNEMYYGACKRPEIEPYLNSIPARCPKRALDLGCGEGRMSIYLADKGFQVTAVDISQVGTQKLFRIKQKKDLDIEILHQNIQNFNFPLYKFDLIVANTILDHLENNVRFAVRQQIKKSLKPGGLLYATVFTTNDPGYRQGSNSNRLRVSETSQAVCYYFKPNELAEKFDCLETLFYTEGFQKDLKHGHPHYHGYATLIAKK